MSSSLNDVVARLSKKCTYWALEKVLQGPFTSEHISAEDKSRLYRCRVGCRDWHYGPTALAAARACLERYDAEQEERENDPYSSC